MAWTRRLETLDRRWLFLAMGLLVAGPLIFPAGLPLKVSPPVKGFHDTIEKLPNRSTVLMKSVQSCAIAAEARKTTARTNRIGQ